ncbi:GntR family transcriptional regulator [Streptomyces sp. NPDC004752]
MNMQSSPDLGLRSATAKMSTYLRVANELAEEIRDLPAGHQLPSENELASRYGVSRLTARAAMQELERRFVVTRVRGRGSFVARRLEILTRVGSSPSWSEAVRQAGGQPSLRVLNVAEVAISDEVRRILRLDDQTTAFQVDRLCYVDGLIAEVTRTWFPKELVPRLDDLLGRGGSQTVLLESFGYRPRKTWVRTDLVPVPGEIARLLELEGQPAVLHTASIVEDAETGVPLLTGESWMRPDVVRTTVEVGVDAKG